MSAHNLKIYQNNTFSSKFDIGTFMNDARAFTTELKGDWSQMVGSMPHHFFPYFLASGKEDVVKMFI